MKGEPEEKEFNWKIYRDCLKLLREQPKLAIFVILSPILTFISWIPIIYTMPMYRAPQLIIWIQDTVPLMEFVPPNVLTVYAYLLMIMFVSSLVITFCNVGLLVCTKRVIEGKSPGMISGISAGIKHLPAVLLSSILTALIGFIIALAERSNSGAAKVFAYIFGASYGVATFFALPSVVLGSENALTMYGKSVSLVKDRFGEVTRIALGVYASSYVVASLIASIPIAPTIPIILIKPISPSTTAAGLEIMNSTGYTIFGLIMFSVAISIFIFGLNFAAILKTVIYVDTTEGREPDMLNESVKEIDKQNGVPDREAKPS